MLIIIDGANGMEFDSICSLLKKTGCDVIITSRYRYDHAIELGLMDHETWEGFIISQLSEKTDENSTDYKMAAELICRQSAYNSMLIALYVKAIELAFFEIGDKLRAGFLIKTADKIRPADF